MANPEDSPEIRAAITILEGGPSLFADITGRCRIQNHAIFPDDSGKKRSTPCRGTGMPHRPEYSGKSGGIGFSWGVHAEETVAFRHVGKTGETGRMENTGDVVGTYAGGSLTGMLSIERYFKSEDARFSVVDLRENKGRNMVVGRHFPMPLGCNAAAGICPQIARDLGEEVFSTVRCSRFVNFMGRVEGGAGKRMPSRAGRPETGRVAPIERRAQISNETRPGREKKPRVRTNTPRESRERFKMVGASGAMEGVWGQVDTFGPVDDIPVLIAGETGVGKEGIARALHQTSPRSGGPFVALNCGALPDTMSDSILFGHSRGAFTGATEAKAGLFEAAKGGTVFLDEIGEMSLWAQVKLLRVLQEKEVVRLGESRARNIDCRVVAATNKDLERAIRDGAFREDLWYRLNVVTIHVPPLRERAEDIPLLVDYFLEKYSWRLSGNGDIVTTSGISDEAWEALIRHSFPGNVRELENAVIHALVSARGGKIGIEHLPPTIAIGLRRKPQPCAGLVCEAELLEDLKALSVPGCRKPWHETLKSATVEEIHRFLAENGARWFSRREFAEYLMKCRGTSKSKYAASGLYIEMLESHGILERNGEQTNRRRFILSRRFLVG